MENQVTNIKSGALAAWPICLGYFPIGLALGVLAQQAGIPWWAVAMMSIIVFAGSAQFICVSMLVSSASPLAIILTTFVVNFRHTLMSSALAVYLSGVNRKFLAIFAYGLTDESFAVNMALFKGGAWNRFQALSVNHVANFTWCISTVAGCLIGQFIPKGAFGIDYALSAMFICLLVFQIQNRFHIFTALIGLGISGIWYLLIPGDSYIVGAAVISATVGYLVKKSYRSRS